MYSKPKGIPHARRIDAPSRFNIHFRMIFQTLTTLALGSMTALGAYFLVEKNTSVPLAIPAEMPAETHLLELKNTDTIPLPDNPIELGHVRWLRSLDSATVLARRTNRPILILFQEVPGCANCTRFGSGTLQHPLIVEAIEEHFVPLCIFNNRKGADAAALDYFDELAWNNPVVRIVTYDGTDEVPRMDDFRSSAALVEGIYTALKRRGRVIPDYLRLLHAELLARERGTQVATFSMSCFWSGEGALGQLEGVIESEPGYQDGREVVRVVYDSMVIQLADFQKITQPKGITACARNEGFRSDRQPKYYLAHTDWRAVPMTPTQACRANSLVGDGKSPDCVFSPRQVALYQRIGAAPATRKRPNLIGQLDLVAGWKAIREF
jgi:Thioredoxin-like